MDDWDFARQLVWAPSSLNAGPNVDPAEAMVATSLWYFENQKASGGPLSGRLQDAPGIAESNRRGLRWVALSQPAFFSHWPASAAAQGLAAEAQSDPVAFAASQFEMIKLAMSSLGAAAKPVPVLLFAGTSPDAPRIGVAYRSVGNMIELAVPDAPGLVFQAVFDAGGMTPFPVGTPGGGTFTVTGIGALSAGTSLFFSLAGGWSSVVNGTIGNALWPSSRLRAPPETGTVPIEVDPADLVVGPPLTHWWRCGACPASGFVGQLPFTVSDDLTQVFRRAQRSPTGAWGPLQPGQLSTATVSADDLGADLQVLQGIALYQPAPGSGPLAARTPAWFDWQTIRYRRIPVTLTPKQVVTTRDTTVTYGVAVPNPPADPVSYRWIFRHSTAPVDTVVTSTPSHARALDTPGQGTVKIEVLDLQTKRVLAADSGTVDYQAPDSPHWRVTSITNMDSLGTDASVPVTVLLANAVANPGTAMIAVDSVPGGSELRLRVRPGAIWDDTNCCVGGLPLPGEQRHLLGVAPPQALAVGPFFFGFDSSQWSQSTTDLRSGTMSSQYLVGTFSYNVRFGGTQLGPQLAVRFSATRTDSTMTGTITVIYWPIVEVLPGETLMYVETPDFFAFPFTATRIR